MKIKDFISKSIQTYPSLYKSENYEKSKLKVLDHIFFTIGNGLELAWTENPIDGGFVVEPKSKKNKKTDEWERLYDKPYGQETFKVLPESYFEDVVFYITAENKALEITSKKDLYGGYGCLARFDNKTGNDKYFSPKLVEAKCNNLFSPYPFSKGFSIGCDIFYEKLFIQNDWKDELVFLCQKTLDFFEEESQYKIDCYYPDEKSINRHVQYFKDTFIKEGVVGLQELRKLWGYNDSDILPNFQEIETRKWQSFENHKTTQIEFLKAFLAVS